MQKVKWGVPGTANIARGCMILGENPHVTSDFSVMNAKLMDMVFEQIGQA